MEAMTHELEAAALELMQAVEDKGGAVAAIGEGFQKSEIERSAYRIDSNRRTIVGLNRFRLDIKEPYEPMRVDPQIEREQVARLAALRADRDNTAVARALDDLKTAARGGDNVLYPMKEALRLPAAGGEVAHVLRDIWGTYVPKDASDALHREPVTRATRG